MKEKMIEYIERCETIEALVESLNELRAERDELGCEISEEIENRRF